MSVPAVSALVCGRATLRRERRLPVPGEVLVVPGQVVSAIDEVARAQLPGGAVSLRAAALLGLSPRELDAALRVEVGATVAPGQLLAENREWLGLVRKQVHSPVGGVVESASTITGLLRVREAPTCHGLKAYLPGTVTAILEQRGVVLEAEVTLVQGIFGMGPEHVGPLICLADGPDRNVSFESLNETHRGAVVVLGRTLDTRLLERARALCVGVVVAGSASGQVIVDFAGREINPAVTVEERRPPTLILTEGFGDLVMRDSVFAAIAQMQGESVSVSGATQIRAGVLRPELIASMGVGEESISDRVASERVRIVRGAHLGRSGHIVAAPLEPVVVDSGVRCLVFEVELDEGGRALVPRPNVEQI